VNAIQIKYGPFAQECPKHWGMTHVTTCGVVDRIAMVKASCDADWLEAVIKHCDTQKTVRLAAERRLRWVEKACIALLNDYQLREAAGE
jgi:hypothetical protein